MLYLLQQNHKRMVIGTEEDFELLAQEPRPERDFKEIVVCEAESWPEAQEWFQMNGYV